MTTREAALEKALTMIRDKWVPALLRDCREADKTDCNAQSIYGACVRAIATPPSPVEQAIPTPLQRRWDEFGCEIGNDCYTDCIETLREELGKIAFEMLNKAALSRAQDGV